MPVVLPAPAWPTTQTTRSGLLDGRGDHRALLGRQPGVVRVDRLAGLVGAHGGCAARAPVEREGERAALDLGKLLRRIPLRRAERWHLGVEAEHAPVSARVRSRARALAERMRRAAVPRPTRRRGRPRRTTRASRRARPRRADDASRRAARPATARATRRVRGRPRARQGRSRARRRAPPTPCEGRPGRGSALASRVATAATCAARHPLVACSARCATTCARRVENAPNTASGTPRISAIPFTVGCQSTPSLLVSS